MKNLKTNTSNTKTKSKPFATSFKCFKTQIKILRKLQKKETDSGTELEKWKPKILRMPPNFS